MLFLSFHICQLLTLFYHTYHVFYLEIKLLSLRNFSCYVHPSLYSGCHSVIVFPNEVQGVFFSCINIFLFSCVTTLQEYISHQFLILSFFTIILFLSNCLMLLLYFPFLIFFCVPPASIFLPLSFLFPCLSLIRSL